MVATRASAKKAKVVNSCPFCQNGHKPSAPCGTFGDKRVFDSPDALFLSSEEMPGLSFEHMTAWQKSLHYFGKVFAGVVALGSGVSTAAACITLAGTGPVGLALAGGFLLATALINWSIFKTAVPKVLVSLLGRKPSEDLLAVKGGCDLIKVDDEEKLPEDLSELPLSSKFAYIRHKSGHNNQLLIFDKLTKQSAVVLNGNPPASEEQLTKLKQFDEAMQIDALEVNKAVPLSIKGLAEIKNTTGHSLMSKTKLASMFLGGFFALSVGITFGALAYVGVFTLPQAFLFLAAVTPALPYVAAVIAAGTVVCLSALMLRDIVDLIKTPNARHAFTAFVKNMFRTGTNTTVLTRETKPTWKNLHNVYFNSIYVRVGNQLYFADRQANTIELVQGGRLDPNTIGLDDWKGLNDKELSYDDLKIITDQTGQKAKSKPRVILERVSIGLLTGFFIAAAIFGLLTTQIACVPGVRNVLLKFLHNSPASAANTVDAISKIICLGCGFLGQLPFTLLTTVQTIMAPFGSNVGSLSEGEQGPRLSVRERLECTALYCIAFINALGNGAISMVGGMVSKAASWVMPILSGFSGWWNSEAAGFSSVDNAYNKTDPTETPALVARYNAGDKGVKREKMSIERYHAIRDNKKRALKDYIQEQGLEDSPIKKPGNKPKKVLVFDPGFNKVDIYFTDQSQYRRFMFFDIDEHKPDASKVLTKEDIDTINADIDNSIALASPRVAS